MLFGNRLLALRGGNGGGAAYRLDLHPSSIPPASHGNANGSTDSSTDSDKVEGKSPNGGTKGEGVAGALAVIGILADSFRGDTDSGNRSSSGQRPMLGTDGALG